VLTAEDTLAGGEGNDIIYGEAITVTVEGAGATLEGGNDNIDGGAGADTIVGDFDTLQGTIGTFTSVSFRDVISGGDGSDTLYGDMRVGNDKIAPLPGSTGFSDNIDGGAGANDTADAGPGTDICTNVEHPTNCEIT
jgi:RTX calcium-binding nonapeptide repeat (4 copies)